MADQLKVSGSDNPYEQYNYTVESNDKNTLTITGFFKLMAAQLQNQDMSNPMDNSEMMAQMTQMAMVQSMTAMTSAVQTSSAVTTSTYAAGLVGKKVTVADTVDGPNGIPIATGVKYGVVASVSLAGNSPVLMLEGDSEEYPLSYILGMGEIKDPYNKPDEPDKPEEPDPPDGTDAPEAGNGKFAANHVFA